LTTKGFRDVLEIGLSYREHPYDLQAEQPPPLVPRPLRRELTARMSADGTEIAPFDPDEVRAEAAALVDAGVEAIAIVLLHSYANPAHELAARDVIASEFPDVHVSLSSQIDPQVREYERTSTTVLNAYSMPAVVRYTSRFENEVAVKPRSLMFMHSGGGVIPPDRARERPIELVSSGPAGGVLAAAFLGQQIGIENIVTFDTGGTSSDVCLIESGEAQERDSIEVEWGVPIRVRCIDVMSVGAGGGSIGWVDSGGALRVGPQSAGANPGPACYGRGGTEATVTDANLVLGLIDPDRFLGGRVSLDLEAARAAVAGLADELGHGIEDTALGMRRIAIANMAQAVHSITVQKGIDPRGFTLVAFGGAGGQHATDVADEMEIKNVVFPPFASTLSALGLLVADIRVTEQKAFLKRLGDDVVADAESTWKDLREQAERSLTTIGDDVAVEEQRFAHLRYAGQTHELAVAVPSSGWDGLPGAFEDSHERRYGTRLGDPVEAVALGVTLSASPAAVALPTWAASDPAAETSVEVFGTVGAVRTYERASLAPGREVEGPCVIYEEDSTIVVGTGWTGRVGALGEIACVRD
jgi:N-methylhydantoinase A